MAYIDNLDELRDDADTIASRINEDPKLGILLLSDPVRVLAEIGYTLSPSAARKARASLFGATRAQADRFDDLSDRLESQGYVPGITRVRLRANPATAVRTSALNEEVVPRDAPSNPLGGFDTVLELSEATADHVAKLAYDEHLFPRRFNVAIGEVIIGRPLNVNFDVQQDDCAMVTLPVAFVPSGGQPMSGTATVIMNVSMVSSDGSPGSPPDHVAVNFEAIEQLELAGLEDAVVNLLLPALQNALPNDVQRIPISPLFRNLSEELSSSLGIDPQLTDITGRVNNAPGSELDSFSTCLMFSTNRPGGDLKQVIPFVKASSRASDEEKNKIWALGLGEEVISEQFDLWWNGDEGKNYQRVNKSKAENFRFGSSKMEEIFDENGDIRIGKPRLSIKSGKLQMAVEVTLEDIFLWFDVDVELTTDILLRIDAQTSALEFAVTNIDTSLSCWDIFLIALFMGFVGAIVGAVVGAIIGGVVGAAAGAVASGIAAGAAIGAAGGLVLGSLLTAIFAKIEQAQMEDKLRKGVSGPGGPPRFFEVTDVKHDWQIPDTDLVIGAIGEWIELVDGEMLMGGRADLPPLTQPTVEIATKTSGMTHGLDQALIDAFEQAHGASRSRAALSDAMQLTSFTIICTAEPSDDLEGPFHQEWSLDGYLLGEGEQLKVDILPSIELTATGYKVHVERVARLLMSNGKWSNAFVTTTTQPLDINAPEIDLEAILAPAGITPARRKFYLGEFLPVKLKVTDIFARMAEANRDIGGIVMHSGMEGGTKDSGLPDWLHPDIDLEKMLSGMTEPVLPPSAVLRDRVGVALVRSSTDPRWRHRRPLLAKNLVSTKRIARLPR